MANEFVAKNGLISQNNTTVSGSLTVTQNVSASSFTGSLLGTATTASYISSIKAQSGSIVSFAGTPYSASVTFGIAYSNNLYSVAVTGEDMRIWTVSSKSSTGFTINSNSSVALSNPVYWITSPFN